jgi:hypothetical protein
MKSGPPTMEKMTQTPVKNMKKSNMDKRKYFNSKSLYGCSLGMTSTSDLEAKPHARAELTKKILKNKSN